MNSIRIGTRGSALALWQTNYTKARLLELVPKANVEIRVIKTSGDLIQDRALLEVGGKGLFVKEIQVALLSGEVDLAVHSLKDYPAEKFYRDVKLCTIGEGTSEIQRLVIARQLLKD